MSRAEEWATLMMTGVIEDGDNSNDEFPREGDGGSGGPGTGAGSSAGRGDDEPGCSDRGCALFAAAFFGILIAFWIFSEIVGCVAK